MRLFTGIPIPGSILTKLGDLQRHLRPTAPIQWSPVENFHITLKFIGQWPEERLPEIRACLASVRHAGRIPIRICGLGFFPNARSPRVFWAGVEGGPLLRELASTIDDGLSACGVPREDRPYSPHLTLARIQNREPVGMLRETCARLTELDFGSFEASEFHLYSSKTGPKGSVYTTVDTFRIFTGS